MSRIRIVLDNVRRQVQVSRPRIAEELHSVGDVSLATYLHQADRTLADIYRGRSSWTELRRAAGLPTAEPGPDEDGLLRRLVRLAHVDDPERLTFLRRFLEADTPPPAATLSLRDQRLLAMLFFSLWPDGGGFSTVDEGLRHLWRHPAVRAEMLALGDVLDEGGEYVPRPLSPHFADVPLWAHCRYSREELLAAAGHARLDRVPRADMAGVRWVEDLQTDVLTVTLQKSERHYSPTTQYRDYAISPELFHWETQNITSTSSPTGQRYLNQRNSGTHVLLFARETRTDDAGAAAPFLLMGEADYVSHTGERPIAITWRLRQPLPARFFASAAVVAG